jgi:hypothetical protein
MPMTTNEFNRQNRPGRRSRSLWPLPDRTASDPRGAEVLGIRRTGYGRAPLCSTRLCG